MKYCLIILYLTSLILTEVYSIVPKYVPSAALLSEQKSLDNSKFLKHRQFQPPEVPEIGNTEERDVHGFVNKASNNLQTFTIDLLGEEESRNNRLPEVNLKDFINSAEVPNDESVEDFVDLSFEETGNDSAEAEINKNIYEKKHLLPISVYSNKAGRLNSLEEEMVLKVGNIIDNKRFKRVAAAAYDGRYKSQDINDVLKSVTVTKSQTTKLDNKMTKNDLIKSRRERDSNIIEEENLVTTISVFKFTGRSFRLNEDLAFKNIHT